MKTMVIKHGFLNKFVKMKLIHEVEVPYQSKGFAVYRCDNHYEIYIGGQWLMHERLWRVKQFRSIKSAMAYLAKEWSICEIPLDKGLPTK